MEKGAEHDERRNVAAFCDMPRPLFDAQAQGEPTAGVRRSLVMREPEEVRMPISFESAPRASLGFVLAALALAGCSAASTRPSGSDDQASLLALQDQWAAARVRRDVGFLEHLYAKEFRVTSLTGAVVDRASDIANFASGDLKPEQVSDDDMTATVYGDSAVVTGREYMKGTYKGRFGEFTVRFTNVYVRRDGRWQLVAHQSTQTAKK